MTKQTRRKFSPEFKAKVALEAAKEQLTLAQLSQKFEVNAVTISKWKSEFLANMSAAFSNAKESSTSEQEVPVEQLYAQIGKLKEELDFFKKSGWFLLIPIYNLILACTDGVKGDNEYGTDPKASL